MADHKTHQHTHTHACMYAHVRACTRQSKNLSNFIPTLGVLYKSNNFLAYLHNKIPGTNAGAARRRGAQRKQEQEQKQKQEQKQREASKGKQAKESKKWKKNNINNKATQMRSNRDGSCGARKQAPCATPTYMPCARRDWKIHRVALQKSCVMRARTHV